MSELDSYGGGFIYCAARKGGTGKHSELDTGFSAYLRRCRSFHPPSTGQKLILCEAHRR